MPEHLDNLIAFWKQQAELYGEDTLTLGVEQPAAVLNVPADQPAPAAGRQNVLPVITPEKSKTTAGAEATPAMRPGLDELAQKAARCTACTLSQTRSKVVFGAGSRKPRIIFIGEAPDREDDLNGTPFSGKAIGSLFDRMLTRMGFSRDEVYISFPVKCKPPANRQPTGDEIAACSGFLQQQIEALQPRYIFCLGRVAAAAILKTSADIETLRKSELSYKGIRVFVTHHPSALQHNQDLFWAVFEDMKRFRAVYDREIGDKEPMPDSAKPGKNG